jgi:hypothetical protein
MHGDVTAFRRQVLGDSTTLNKFNYVYQLMLDEKDKSTHLWMHL